MIRPRQEMHYMLVKLLCSTGLLIAALTVTAAVEVDFGRDRWSSNDWQVVKVAMVAMGYDPIDEFLLITLPR